MANELRQPPAQTVHGVLIYHDDPQMDDRIRQVQFLRESGYDIDNICKAVNRSHAQVYTYLRQVRLARIAYIQAFPEDFQGGAEALQEALFERRQLDQSLRRELASLVDDKNPSNKVGIYKLVMRNMRETEELAGLLVERLELGGEIAVKDQLRQLLDDSPAEIRESYLDALATMLATAKAREHPSRADPE